MEREFETIKIKSCPVCGIQLSSDVIEKYDDRFGQPDMFFYVHCSICNTIVLKNRILEANLAELYKRYYGKGNQLNAKSSKLKLILEKIKLDKVILQWLAGNKCLLGSAKNNSKVLEIGPGYDPDLRKIISTKRLAWIGLEVDEESVKKLREDNLTVFHGTINSNNINIQEKLNYIISSQSLEHQYNINDFFEKSVKLLKKEGKIIFTTPNFDSRYRKKYKEKWINWHAPYHITILSKKTIDRLCKKHGFVVSRFFTYTPTSWYMLQKNFEIPKQGEGNIYFNFDFSLIKQLLVSVYLRIYEIFSRNDGDCIYCELKIK
jgi:hypothetical protein